MRKTCTMTIATACAAALATVVTSAAPAPGGFNREKLAAVQSTLQASIDAGELPGVVTLVWRRGELAQVSTLGYRDIERRLPMEDDTIFRIASMTKPITSVAALMLVEQGLLSLDDAITKWVPEFAMMRVLRRPDSPLDDTYPALRVITVEDLLTHRSGLAYPYTATGPLAAALEKTIGSEIHSRLLPDEWIKALAALPLASAPGEQFQYGVSTTLLGFVVARASGTSLRDFLLARVFRPLGMTDTDFWIPPAKRDRAAVVYASGPSRSFRRMDPMSGFVGDAPPVFNSGGEGLVTTAHDYLMFARLLLNRGEVAGVRLLKRETLQMMITNHLTPAQRQIPLLGLPIWRAMGFGLGVSMITNAQAYNMAGIGAGSDGAFSWPGSFGGWWQADPAEDMVAIFLPQMAPNLQQVVPAATTMRAFQKMVYGAIEH